MRILYVTTRFPVYSETFVQREARAFIRAGVELKILSLHGGRADFEGHAVSLFRKRELWKLLYLLPWAAWTSGGQLSQIVRSMNARRPASLLNLLENLLGFGAAIVEAGRIRDWRPDIIHCVWASAPAAYGMVASVLTGKPYSTGAHAYDIFEHGGDWLLREKLGRAALVHVSTDVAKNRIRKIHSQAKVKRIRRGLSSLPEAREPRPTIDCLRIVCVARLVEKKGFPQQLNVYRALRDAGLPFEARIIGDGPLEADIRARIRRLGLEAQARLFGRLSESEVMDQLRWADVLFHTGVVAASGDRDGLPNVVPEAMAAGALVFGSPVSGVVEAVVDGETGFLCQPDDPEIWVERCAQTIASPDLRRRLARQAREWAEREFMAERNTGRLLACLEAVGRPSETRPGPRICRSR